MSESGDVGRAGVAITLDEVLQSLPEAERVELQAQRELNGLCLSVAEWLRLSNSLSSAVQERSVRYLSQPTGVRLRGSKRVQRRLEELLEGPPGRLVNLVLLLLWRVRIPQISRKLLPILKSADSDRRTQLQQAITIGALAHQRDSSVIGAMCEFIRRKDLPVALRASAVRAVGDIGADQVIPELLIAAEDDGWELNWELAGVLEKLSHPLAHQFLVHFFSNGSWLRDVEQHMVSGVKLPGDTSVAQLRALRRGIKLYGSQALDRTAAEDGCKP